MPSLRDENRIRGYAKTRVVNSADQYQVINANNATTGAAVRLGQANKGDYLDSLLCIVTDVANAKVEIQDGAGDLLTVLPGVLPAGNTTIAIPIGLTCVSNNWGITTGTGVQVIARGTW